MYIKLLYSTFYQLWHGKLLRENDANSIFAKSYYENVAQILAVMTKKKPFSGDISFNFAKRNGLKSPNKNKFKEHLLSSIWQKSNSIL